MDSMNDSIYEFIEQMDIFAFKRSEREFIIARHLIDNSGYSYLVEPVKVTVDSGRYTFFAMNFSWIDLDQTLTKHRLGFEAKYKYYRICLSKKLFLEGVIDKDQMPEYADGFQDLVKIETVDDLDQYLIRRQLLSNN